MYHNKVYTSYQNFIHVKCKIRKYFRYIIVFYQLKDGNDFSGNKAEERKN
jgi:hypothetical protein